MTLVNVVEKYTCVTHRNGTWNVLRIGTFPSPTPHHFPGAEVCTPPSCPKSPRWHRWHHHVARTPWRQSPEVFKRDPNWSDFIIVNWDDGIIIAIFSCKSVYIERVICMCIYIYTYAKKWFLERKRRCFYLLPHVFFQQSTWTCLFKRLGNGCSTGLVVSTKPFFR